MEKVLGVFKPKATPQEQLREWQRKLRQQSRDVDRQVREIQREEKNVQKAIKEAAKRNDMKSAKSLARELVSSRKAVGRLYENRAQLNSISMHLGESVATARAVGHLQKSTEVMKLVNNLMKAPEMAATMQELSKEMMKAGVMEEMVNDGLDSALDNEDMEEEIEEEVDKVLEELAVETTTQLPASAVPRVRVKPSAESAKQVFTAPHSFLASFLGVVRSSGNKLNWNSYANLEVQVSLCDELLNDIMPRYSLYVVKRND
ncbi:hypothetical protein M758_10G073800 [Ceratodon purpureus]|nr:hypothetical protein M758_10G073800 [Ceratodon purpureus]